MLDLNMLIVMGLGMFVVMLVANHQKLKNKMLCTFRRSNKTKVERWVPLSTKYVVFENGQYNCDPTAITLQWYDRGINKLLPTLVPTLDFAWWTADPINPETFAPTHLSPQAAKLARQDDNFQSFRRAVDKGGSKSRFPEWLFPAITIGGLAVLGYLVYSIMGQLDTINNLIRLK